MAETNWQDWFAQTDNNAFNAFSPFISGVFGVGDWLAQQLGDDPQATPFNSMFGPATTEVLPQAPYQGVTGLLNSIPGVTASEWITQRGNQGQQPPQAGGPAQDLGLLYRPYSNPWATRNPWNNQ